MKKWILKLICLSLLSCSSIQFKSENNIEVSLDKNTTHEKDIEIIINKDFFMLGYFPKHEILIDEVLADKGATEASSVEIENYYDFKNSLWALFTFGVYYPQTYLIKAKVKIDTL